MKGSPWSTLGHPGCVVCGGLRLGQAFISGHRLDLCMSCAFRYARAEVVFPKPGAQPPAARRHDVRPMTEKTGRA